MTGTNLDPISGRCSSLHGQLPGSSDRSSPALVCSHSICGSKQGQTKIQESISNNGAVLDLMFHDFFFGFPCCSCSCQKQALVVCNLSDMLYAAPLAAVVAMKLCCRTDAVGSTSGHGQGEGRCRPLPKSSHMERLLINTAKGSGLDLSDHMMKASVASRTSPGSWGLVASQPVHVQGPYAQGLQCGGQRHLHLHAVHPSRSVLFWRLPSGLCLWQ